MSNYAFVEILHVIMTIILILSADVCSFDFNRRKVNKCISHEVKRFLEKTNNQNDKPPLNQIKGEMKSIASFDPFNNLPYFITGKCSSWVMRTFEMIQQLEVNAT